MERLGTGNHAIYPWRSLIGIGILNDFEGERRKGGNVGAGCQKTGRYDGEDVLVFITAPLIK
jgi:hypothetical protein